MNNINDIDFCCIVESSSMMVFPIKVKKESPTPNTFAYQIAIA